MIKVNDKKKASRCELGKLTLCVVFTTLQSCMILDTGSERVIPPKIDSELNQELSSESSANDSAKFRNSSTDFVEQQNLIEEINRDGLSFSYPGFSEQVPAPVDVQGPDVVELNYEQADLRLVLEQLAESLDISILIDPSIDKRISIRTSPDRPLQREDIWPLIRLLTRDAGIFLERVGDVYNARMINSSLPADIIGPDSSAETVNSQVMQITPLTYVSTETAVEALGPLLAPEGSVSQLGSRDLLMITASDFLLQRANELLMLIDADPFQIKEYTFIS